MKCVWDKDTSKVFNVGDKIAIVNNTSGQFNYRVNQNSSTEILISGNSFYIYEVQNTGAYFSCLKECDLIVDGILADLIDISITYDLNGGSGTTPEHVASNVTVNDGTTTITLEDYSGFYKSEYSFVGWSTNKSDIISSYVINNEIEDQIKDVVFYAVWEKIDGIYWSNNDGLISDCPTLFDAKLSDEINYSFLYKETSDSEGTNQGITITISPEFLVYNSKTKQYVTTYTNNIKGIIQTAGDYVITVNYKDESLSIDVTKTFTLHVQSSLTFNELKINGMTMPDNIFGEVGEVVTIPTDTSSLGKEHYTFVCWNTKDDGTGTDYYPGDSITLGTKVFALFPVWDCDGFVVTYDLNGGDSEDIIDDSAYAEGEDVTITSVVPTRDGYIFVCWNTEKDRSGINYNADQTYKMSDQDVTFYAVWSHVCNDIIFDKIFNSSALYGNAILGGNYYLEEDIIIDGDHGFGTYGEAITISGYDTVNICLNGHILQFNELAFEIKGTLNIYDCDDSEHKFSVDSNGRWVADEENGTKTSTGAYITYSGESLDYPLFYIRSGGNLALHDVDIIGINANLPIIHATYGKNTITLDNGTNIIGNCCNNLDYLIDIRNNTDYDVTINLSDVTISYNVANNPISLYGSGKITTNIGDNVVIKNNVQKYGETLSTGLTLRTYYKQANSMNAFSPLTIKDGVKGTAIDITVLLDYSDYLDHDAIITTGNNCNVSDIFTLTTYAYNGCATVIDNRYVIRNIVDGSINKVYISRWYTITYANRTDIALLKSVGTVSDSTHYFYGDKVTIKDTTGLTIQDRYFYSDLDWYDGSYTFLGWTTSGSAYSLSYDSFYDFYEKNSELTYNFTSGNYGIADNVTLYPTAIPNTLYYSINDGKFHYQDPNSSFIATVLDDMYVAEKDNDGNYTNIIFNNLNYSTDYVHAIEINSASDDINVTFKGTNTVTSVGWCAFNLGSDKVVFNIEGTLNINGGFLFSSLVVSGEGVMNISSSTAINSACSGINGSSLKVEGNAVIYIENTVDNDEYYSFKLNAFDNTVVYAKENKNDNYVVFGDFYNGNGPIVSSRDVDDNLVSYDYIKITSYSVEEPNVSNNYEVSPSVESDYQWYEEKEGLEPLTVDVIVDAMISDSTLDPITFTSEENMIMLAYGSNCIYNALVFKSTTDVDYSKDSNLEDVYEEYKQVLGLCLLSKTYDSATGVYTYKINIEYVEDIGGYASLFITPENTVIYDIYLVSDYKAIDGANSSTYEPTSSGNYIVKTSASYAGYTSDTIVASEVTFNSNGGSGSMNSIVKFSGLSTTLPTIAFTRTNYKFIGWTTTEGGTSVEYTDGASFTFGDNDVTLYAIWELKTTIEISETSQEVTYNAASQEFELKGTHKDAGSFTVEYKVNDAWTTTAPTNAGTYDVKITRSEDDTYASYSKEITSGLVINKVKVTKPTEDTTKFVYNGNEQQYSLTTSNLYTISNDKKTSAGTQTVKVTLSDKDNYVWDDETNTDLEFTFKIEKATYDMTNAKWNYTDAFTYDGNEKKVEVTGLPSGVTVKNYTDNAMTAAGTYTAKVTLSYDSDNYNEVSIDDLSWAINKAKVTKPTEDTTKFVYSGSEQQYTLTTSSLYTISNDKKTSAGTQTVKVTLNDKDNYVWNDETNTDLEFTFTIAKANYDMTNAKWNYTNAFTYDGNEKKVEVTGLPEGVSVKNYTDNAMTAAGTYTAKVTLSYDSDNYNEVSINDLSWTINKAKVTKPTEDTTKFVYNGSEQQYTLTTSSLYTISNDKKTSAGTQTVKVTLNDKDNYVWNDETNADLEFTFTIAKANYDMTNVKWNYTDAFTYDGNEKKVEVTGLPSGVTVKNYTDNAKTNAGTYTAKVTLSYDSDNYNEVSINDQSWTINKATATINTSGVVKTYTYNGKEQVVNSGAILNHNETALVYEDNKFTNVGTGKYIIKISAAETNNYKETSTTVEITVNKATYDMSNAKWNYTDAFTYNGEEFKVEVVGLPEGVSATYSNNTNTEPGVYKAYATLSYDSDNYNEIKIDKLVWEIKSVTITPISESEDEKQEVVVSTDEGFDSTITVTVEVTVEVEIENKQLMVDYYDIPVESAKLDWNEKVGVVFDVKLIQTIDGVSKEIQPSDIKEGTTIKVKMLIPDDVDISKVTKILHVHSADDIEVIEFDSSKVVDGYYEIEVSKLSEFAFVYEKTSYILWIIIALFILLILILISKKKDKKKEENKIKKELTLAETIAAAALVNSKFKLTKKLVADYVDDKYKGKSIVNRRNNYISSGRLPLSDTHYVLKNKKKSCFIFVYELKDNKAFILVKASKKLADNLMKKHPSITPSLFPKTSNEKWYSVFADDSFKTKNDLFDLIDKVYEESYNKLK